MRGLPGRDTGQRARRATPSNKVDECAVGIAAHSDVASGGILPDEQLRDVDCIGAGHACRQIDDAPLGGGVTAETVFG